MDLSRFDLVEVDGAYVVPASKLLDVATFLRNDDFAYFVYCAAAHYPAVVPPPAAEGAEPPAEPPPVEPDRVLVEYRLRRLPNTDVVLRVWVPTGERCPSLAGLWQGADWQEREQFDLVGVLFAGHPDLRRIMLPEDWPGHPLRRDYAIDTRHHPWR